MPNYRIIIQETKSYFIEADNKENAVNQIFDERDVFGCIEPQSCTTDRFDIKEIKNG